MILDKVQSLNYEYDVNKAGILDGGDDFDASNCNEDTDDTEEDEDDKDDDDMILMMVMMMMMTMMRMMMIRMMTKTRKLTRTCLLRGSLDPTPHQKGEPSFT